MDMDVGEGKSSAHADADAFFRRCGLSPAEARRRCHDFILRRYRPTPSPSSSSSSTSALSSPRIEPAACQGYCSYTVCVRGIPTGPGEGVEGEEIVQFRPPAHRLDVDLAARARDVYGALAPATRFLGVLHLDVDPEAGAGAGGGGSSSESDDGGRGEEQHAEGNGVTAVAGNKTPLPLYVYGMSRIPGISLAEFQAQSTSATATSTPQTPEARRKQQDLLEAQRLSLVRDYARFIAAGWHHHHHHHHHSPSPPPEHLLGRIGRTLRWRLERMRDGLPTPRLRAAAAAVLAGLPAVEALPWVLTHGDVVPGNVMVRVDEEEGGEGGEAEEAREGPRLPRLRLGGLLDWAEAEDLPFGVGLYGLEELLGESVIPSSAPDETGTTKTTKTKSPKDSGRYPQPGSTFAYYPSAPVLRAAFYAELGACIPELSSFSSSSSSSPPSPFPPPTEADKGTERDLHHALRLARDAGILLWHGIAFDDGRLDRVVRRGRDDEEVNRLEVFLFGRAGEEEEDAEDEPADPSAPPPATLTRWDIIVARACASIRRIFSIFSLPSWSLLAVGHRRRDRDRDRDRHCRAGEGDGDGDGEASSPREEAPVPYGRNYDYSYKGSPKQTTTVVERREDVDLPLASV